jgi:hypothetical protein
VWDLLEALIPDRWLSRSAAIWIWVAIAGVTFLGLAIYLVVR